MITNPYKVLGVPDGASEAECTRAYKRLAKKYHPDLNPGDKTAEKKMAEINAAYDQIKNGAAGGSASYSSYSAHSSRQSSGSAPDYLSSAAQFIKTGQYSQALNLLNTIEDRNAKWYYLSSLANMALGNRTVAEDHIRTAYAKEPDNIAYHQAYDDITHGINPLNDNPIYTFFDFGDRGAGEPPHGGRYYGGRRGGCLGRLLKFIIIIIVIRLVISLFFYGSSYINQRRYYSNQTPSGGYSQQYDGGEIFGGSSGEGANM